MANKHVFFLCLMFGTLVACHRPDVDSDQQLRIVKASVTDDPATTFDINHTTGTVTIYPSSAKPNWVRGNVVTANFQTTPNTVLAPLNFNDTWSKLVGSGVSIDVMEYNNSKPFRILVRDQSPSKPVSKEYQLQLKAVGPVRFESISALKDTMVISLKYYQTYSIQLPISNLYDGHPQDYQIYATLAGSTMPVELALGYDKYSRDYVQFYFKKQMAKPGVYTIELRKADGQRVTSPTLIRVDNSRDF